MSRTSVYNRNYPGKKIDKGTMLTNDGLKIVHKYMNHALVNQFSADYIVAQNARMGVMYLLNMCFDHFIRVSANTDITYIKQLVNSYMADNEHGDCDALQCVCSFMEAILHQADTYRGYNNYKWSNYGSTQLHIDYPDFSIASDHIRDNEYNSQEYHRIYY